MSKKNSWYLPNDQVLGADGPFSYEEILARLQKKELSLDSYIWGPHLQEAKWMRIIEVEDFHSCWMKYPAAPLPRRKSTGSSLQVNKSFNFTSKAGEYGIENEYRRFPRVPFECEVILHNQKNLIKCSAQDLSEKGLSVQVGNLSDFKSGEEVMITLLDSACAGTFSVNATIMRVLDGPYKVYGLYFLTINPSIRRKIAQFVIDALEPQAFETKTA